MNEKMSFWQFRAFGHGMLAAGVALLVFPPAAYAQRDAGAKVRGDIGRYSGRADVGGSRVVSPQLSYPVRPGYAVQPTPAIVQAQPQPSAEPYEAYSMQPLPFSVGDEVTVVGQAARLMRGRQILGTVPAGEQLRVLRIRGPWVGVAAEIEGREIGGWLWYSEVAGAENDDASP